MAGPHIASIPSRLPRESAAGSDDAAADYLGIDQGPIILMIENYRSGWLEAAH